ncbi:hypothetical protein EAH87_13300 [Sphingomonas koreensis]|nr:hypothetical protein EAH87_13300 [Sphingomonas koreensis]
MFGEGATTLAPLRAKAGIAKHGRRVGLSRTRPTAAALSPALNDQNPSWVDAGKAAVGRIGLSPSAVRAGRCALRIGAGVAAPAPVNTYAGRR